MRNRATIILLCLILFQTPFSARASDGHGYQRWAILASKELRETGLSDLLTARLSDDKDVELVEREQLESVTRELELSAYLSPEASAERLKLGQLLKADAILLLSLKKKNDQQFLELVVSESRYGARLKREFIPFSSERIEAATSQCVEAIKQTREEFADGIRHLFGVTQFLSKNLTHEYDHLQAGYASLLASSLGAHHGVAVIELEEARAIRRELSLTADNLKRRVVPLFVEGEFEMTKAGGDSGPTIRVTVRIKDARQDVKKIDKSDLSGEDVAQFLTREIPKQILQLSDRDGGSPLLPARQFELLVARGIAFSAVGIYEHSTSLREAALLLRPNEFEQRLALIGDYRRWNATRKLADTTEVLTANRNLIHPEEKQAMLARMNTLRRTILRRAMPHVELLVRRRLLNPYEASELAKWICREMAYLPENDEMPRKLKGNEEALRFFWAVYPVVAQLDYNLRRGSLHPALRVALGRTEAKPAASTTRQFQINRWTADAISMLSAHAPMGAKGTLPPQHADHSHTLDDLYRLLTKVAPPDTLLMRMAPTSTNDLNGFIALGTLNANDVHQFWQRLRDSGSKINNFYGRTGLLSLQVRGMKGAVISAEALREADKLMAALEGFHPHEAGYFRRYLEPLRNEIAARLGKNSAKKRHRLPENPIPVLDPSSRVTFRPVPDLHSPWHELVSCGDRLDLMWSFEAVYVMREKGNVRKVFQIDRGPVSFRWTNQIYAVSWDGENIWVATLKSGIHVVSLEGEVLGQVQAEQGLPPYEQRLIGPNLLGFGKTMLCFPIRLHSIEPGKCLAIGEYGKDHRQWFAVLTQEIDESGKPTYQAKVFHQGTHVARDRQNVGDSDSELAFDLSWLTEYTDPKSPQRRLLLVGRTFGRANQQYRPLAIDLESLSVSVFPVRLPSPGFQGPRPKAVVDRGLLFVGPHTVKLHSPVDNSDTHWDIKTVIEWPSSQRSPQQPYLIRNADQFYNPGTTWRRIDPSNWQVEKLNKHPLLNQHRFEHFANSAHYGLVAWNAGDQLYRVLLDSEKSATDEPLDFAFVPANKREKHRQAVNAIRELGGYVDARWGRGPEGRSWEAPTWRTIVFLSDKWRGTDEGLSQLADLYNLRDLQLVKAGAGDGALRHVGQLTELESLELVETNITDTGLAELSNLRKLSRLRLECTVGGREFTNVGLKHVGGLPALRKLMLYGQGFTDAGLANFHGRRPPFTLSLFDTGFTRQGISELRQQVRSIMVYDGDSHRLFQ